MQMALNPHMAANANAPSSSPPVDPALLVPALPLPDGRGPEPDAEPEPVGAAPEAEPELEPEGEAGAPEAAGYSSELA